MSKTLFLKGQSNMYVVIMKIAVLQLIHILIKNMFFMGWGGDNQMKIKYWSKFKGDFKRKCPTSGKSVLSKGLIYLQM